VLLAGRTHRYDPRTGSCCSPTAEKVSLTMAASNAAVLRVTADSQTWIGFLRNERNVVWALLRRKIRLTGPLKLLVAFGKCFPPQ
jgi:hypothetical protein